MASVYYGLNEGQAEEATSVGTATNNTDVEVRVNTTNVPSRLSLLLTLGKIAQQILKRDYPAA